MLSVLGGVSLGCLAGAAGVLGRWWTRRTDELGRPRDLPVWSVSALVVVALLAAVPSAHRRVQERRLAHVALVLVGHRVAVHCQSGAAAFVDAGSELGWVPFDAAGRPEPRTLIKRDQCRFLERYRSGDHAHPTRDEVVAVHVLTHEAMHMRGSAVESAAECEAVQRDAVTAQELGASPAEAHALAVDYWLHVYPRMPDDYWTRDCGPGRPLDEGLTTAPW